MHKLLLSSLLVIAAGREALAFNPQPDPPGFPLHAINPDEVARFSVVNAGTTTCNVLVRFFDGDNDVIASQTLAIAPGDQAAVVVAGRDVVPAGSLRAYVRPVLSRADDPRLLPPDPCMGSLLLRNTVTGATTFATGKLVRPALAPASSFRATSPLVVPSANQHAQLLVSNTSADPAGPACQATLSFRAPGGKTIASRTVTLAPGAMSALDVAGAGTAIWAQAILAEDPGHPGTPPDPCMISYEVYNANTGAMTVGAALGLVTP
ncbi:MAG TPA: hypothetical protein VFQ53_16450 [Kofleriaceae bacterium]|nr:hypothetical protein [Kofleriaceae bacterium]